MLQKIMSKTESPVVFMSVFPFWITGIVFEIVFEETASFLLGKIVKN